MSDRWLTPTPASKPSCPEGIMQWQHGTFTVDSTTGKLVLKPFAVDGRQLLSIPCEYKDSEYTRYEQEETFDSFEVYVDPYHNVKRLNLYEYDGTPMNPMFLIYDPPEMLPTSTLNPTPTAKNRIKRWIDDGGEVEPMNKNAIVNPVGYSSLDTLWWVSVALTIVGGGWLYAYC